MIYVNVFQKHCCRHCHMVICLSFRHLGELLDINTNNQIISVTILGFTLYLDF